MEDVVRKEFLNELLDALDSLNNKAITDQEKELMYRIVLALNDNVDFVN